MNATVAIGREESPANNAVASSNRLPVLAAEIAAEHAAVAKAGEAFVRHAVEAGRRLNEAKGLVAHGDWERWLAENVAAVSKRTAQRYMRAAKSAGKTTRCRFSVCAR